MKVEDVYSRPRFFTPSWLSAGFRKTRRESRTRSGSGFGAEDQVRIGDTSSTAVDKIALSSDFESIDEASSTNDLESLRNVGGEELAKDDHISTNRCFELEGISGGLKYMIEESEVDFSEGFREGGRLNMMNICRIGDRSELLFKKLGNTDEESDNGVEDIVWKPEIRETKIACDVDKKVFEDKDLLELFSYPVSFSSNCLRNVSCCTSPRKDTLHSQILPPEPERCYVVEGREVLQGEVVELESRWTMDFYCRRMDAQCEQSCRSLEGNGGLSSLECLDLDGCFLCSFCLKDSTEDRSGLLEYYKFKTFPHLEDDDNVWRPEIREMSISRGTEKTVLEERKVEISHSSPGSSLSGYLEKINLMFPTVWKDKKKIEIEDIKTLNDEGNQLSLEALLERHLIETALAFDGKGKGGLADFLYEKKEEDVNHTAVTEVRSALINDFTLKLLDVFMYIFPHRSRMDVCGDSRDHDELFLMQKWNGKFLRRIGGILLWQPRL